MVETSSSHTTGVTGLRELRSFPGPGTRLAWRQLPKMTQAANCRRLAIRAAVVEGRKKCRPSCTTQSPRFRFGRLVSFELP
jgi:hypothetical protein